MTLVRDEDFRLFFLQSPLFVEFTVLKKLAKILTLFAGLLASEQHLKYFNQPLTCFSMTNCADPFFGSPYISVAVEVLSPDLYRPVQLLKRYFPFIQM